MARLWITSLLLTAACSLSSCDQERPESDLVLLYTGNVNGYIEPCGCVAGQIGGIDRIAGFIEGQRKELGDRALFIDTGDLFAEGIIDDANTRDQLAHKGRGFLDVWRELGCEGIALGEAEVGVGIDVVKALADDVGQTILAGNVVDATGAYPFAESIILERGGFKIGVFSLLGEVMNEPKPKKDKAKLHMYDMRRLLSEQGYELLPWKKRAAEIVAELGPQVDILMCASHLGFNRNEELARLEPTIDVIFGGHFGTSEGQTTMVGQTPVLTTRLRGSRVGRMEWWLPNPDEYLSAEVGGKHGELKNDSAYDEALIGMDVSRQVYGELAGMERKYGSQLWARKRDTQVAMFNASENDLAELPADPGGNRFSNNQLPMHHGIARSISALEAVDRYHEDSNDMWKQRAGEAGEIPMQKRLFKGAEACIDCHQAQYEFWLGTRHSRAFATLQATSQETDAECIDCHTVGYEVNGGFPTPALSAGFENVQCAACHGADAAHLAGGANYMLPGLINRGLNGCARCHRDEHDPSFEQQGGIKLAKVACPPIAPPGLTSNAMTTAYLEAASGLKKRPRPNWDLIGQAYASANEPEMAFEAAREWNKLKPKSLRARLNLADRALNVGKLPVAVLNYRIVTDQSPDDARAWAGLAWSLFSTDPAESLMAAREAYAIDPDNPFGARIVGMGLMATGKIDEARTMMKKHIAFHPEHETGLRDLLDQLPSGE